VTNEIPICLIILPKPKNKWKYFMMMITAYHLSIIIKDEKKTEKIKLKEYRHASPSILTFF
jgi:hypothetical protein